MSLHAESSAWNVFVDHWLIEENKARRKAYFQKIKDKISLSVTIRMLVLSFKKLLLQYERMEDGEEKRRFSLEVQNKAMMLVVIKAMDGGCDSCGKHCMGFYIEDTHLWRVCHNKECRVLRHVAFSLFV